MKRELEKRGEEAKVGKKSEDPGYYPRILLGFLKLSSLRGTLGLVYGPAAKDPKIGTVKASWNYFAPFCCKPKVQWRSGMGRSTLFISQPGIATPMRRIITGRRF